MAIGLCSCVADVIWPFCVYQNTLDVLFIGQW